MKVVFENARFRPTARDGANAHIRQFIQNAVSLGHELYMTASGCHPLATPFPSDRWSQLRTLRGIDVVYVRLEHAPARACRWATGAIRQLIGNPVMAWEFNTVPEFGAYRGLTPEQIERNVNRLRQLGSGCDLAVCVSEKLAEYVRSVLGIMNTVVVPNGSDPDLYQPGAPVVNRLAGWDPQGFHVVWIGSASLGWHNLELIGETARTILRDGNRHGVTFHLIGQGFGKMGDMPPIVHYHGAEDYEMLPGWIAAMDVGLCLYRPGPADFSSPLKLFDYMSAGLAVVATRQPQVEQVLGELGTPELLLEREDPDLLAKVLQDLAADRERVRRIGLGARALVTRKYTWRRAAADTFAALESIVAGRAGARSAEGESCGTVPGGLEGVSHPLTHVEGGGKP